MGNCVTRAMRTRRHYTAPMEPLFELEFETTEEDWISLMHRQAITPALITRLRRRMVYSCIVASAIWIGAVGLVGYFSASSHTFGLINAGVFMIAMGATSAVICRKKVTREGTRRHLMQQAERSMRCGEFGPLKAGAFHLALYNDCAISTFDGQTITFPWASAAEPVAEKDALFLEFPGNGLIRVPDPGFVSREQRQRFVALAEHLRKNAQPR